MSVSVCVCVCVCASSELCRAVRGWGARSGGTQQEAEFAATIAVLSEQEARKQAAEAAAAAAADAAAGERAAPVAEDFDVTAVEDAAEADRVAAAGEKAAPVAAFSLLELASSQLAKTATSAELSPSESQEARRAALAAPAAEDFDVTAVEDAAEAIASEVAGELQVAAESNPIRVRVRVRVRARVRVQAESNPNPSPNRRAKVRVRGVH